MVNSPQLLQNRILPVIPHFLICPECLFYNEFVIRDRFKALLSGIGSQHLFFPTMAFSAWPYEWLICKEQGCYQAALKIAAMIF